MISTAIAKHLHGLGLVVFDPVGTTGNCFVEHMPPSPDLAVMVKSTGGNEQPTKDPSDNPVVQLLVRGAPYDPTGPHDLAKALYSALQVLDGVWLDQAGPDAAWVIGCTGIQSSPIGIGQDDQQRHEWSLNFSLHTHSPTANRPAYS